MSNLKNLMNRVTLTVKVKIDGSEGKLTAKSCGTKSFLWNDVREAITTADSVGVKVKLRQDTDKETLASWKDEKGSEFAEFIASKEGKKAEA